MTARTISPLTKCVFEGNHQLYNGDCITLVKSIESASVDLTVTSPPYFIGKEYDTSKSLSDFEELHEELLAEVYRITKPGGSICWQIGYHVEDSSVTPLDFVVFQIASKYSDLKLRNRIIWTYGHGLHGKNRFSGRHEVILWFTKGNNHIFNLDDIRVPQKYPGKRHYKGDNKGKLSGNPLGKNPSDIWDIPNVKSNHVEKTAHPCQFPIELPQRLIKGLTNEGDLVFDPFFGVGSTAIACELESRRFIGSELDKSYFDIARDRIKQAQIGELKHRPFNKPVYKPNGKTAVSKKPAHFK